MRPTRLCAALTSLASLSIHLVACGATDATDEAQGAMIGAGAARPQVHLQGDGSGGKILVVVSAARTIDLKPKEDGHTYLPSVAINEGNPNDYITGAFARELSEPLKALAQTGKYTFEFASEDGALPTWDKNGLELPWFFWGERDPVKFVAGAAHAASLRDEAVSFLQEAFGALQYSDKAGTPELKAAIATWDGWADAPKDRKSPRSLAEIADGIERGDKDSDYAALLVPGGHAPMSDLAFNPDLGRIVRHFHEAVRPIGVICHGPVALMSTLATTDDAKNVPGGWTWHTADDRARRVQDWHAMKAKGTDWPFAGYRITIESTPEEQIMEMVFAGGRRVAYYVDGEAAKMGATLAPAPGIELPLLSFENRLVDLFKTSLAQVSPGLDVSQTIETWTNVSNPELKATWESEKSQGRLWLPGLSKVTVDREVISGQSPASAYCVGVMMDRAIRHTDDASMVDCDGNQ